MTRRTDLVHSLRAALLPDGGGSADGRLVAAFRDGRDGEAFAALVRRHGPMVWGVCRRALASHPDAEDAFQATFLVLARRAATLRDPEAVGPWLYGVARRTALKARALRAKRRLWERPLEAVDEPAAPSAEPPFDLDAALGRLPERYRAAIVLCDLEDRPRREVSGLFGVPEGTLSGWLTRGRAMLARRLGSQGMAVVAGALAASAANAAPPSTLVASTAKLASEAVAVSPQVFALAHGAMKAMTLTNLKIATAAVLALAATGLGVGVLAQQPPPPAPPVVKAPPPAPPVSAEVKKVDAFGDPLPAGAVLRLGTIRYRVPGIAGIGFRPTGELVVFTEDLSLHVFPADGSPKAKVTLVAGKKIPNWYRAMSANAKYAAGAVDRTTVIWDVSGDTPVEYHTVVGKGDRHKVFSADGEWLAMAGQDRNRKEVLHLCHLPTKAWRELEAPNSMYDMAFAADNNTLVVTGQAEVAVLDAPSGKLGLSFKPPRLLPSMAALSPDGSTLAIASIHFLRGDLRPVRFFNAKDGTELTEWKGPAQGGTALTLRYAPDGKHLLVGTAEGILEWDPAEGKAVRTMPGPTYYQAACVHSPDGKRIAFHSEDAFGLWDVAAGKPIHPEWADAGHTRKVSVVTVSPDGKTIATAADHGIRLWSAADGTPLCRVECGRPHGPVAFHPDSGSFAAIDRDSITPVLWDAKTGAAIRRFDVPAEETMRESMDRPAISADGKTLTAEARSTNTAGRSYRMIWDVATGKLLDRAELPGPRDLHDETLESPDGRWRYKNGKLTRLADMETVEVAPGQSTVLTPALFPRDGRTLFAATTDRGLEDKNNGRVIVFDLESKTPAAELDTGLVARMAVSKDGKRLAVMNRTDIAVWDVATRKVVHRIPFEHGPLLLFHGMDFTPDGKRLVAGADDGTALVWDVK